MEIAPKAKEAALSWGKTVTIKSTWTDQCWDLLTPGIGIEPGTGTVTYLIDGQNVTVRASQLAIPTGPDEVTDPLIQQGMSLVEQTLEAAANGNGRASMHSGKLSTRAWSFRSPVSASVAQQSLDSYRAGQLDLAAYSIILAGAW